MEIRVRFADPEAGFWREFDLELESENLRVVDLIEQIQAASADLGREPRRALMLYAVPSDKVGKEVAAVPRFELTLARLLSKPGHMFQSVDSDLLEGSALVVLPMSARPWIANPAWAPARRIYQYYEPTSNHAFTYDFAEVINVVFPNSVKMPAMPDQPFEPNSVDDIDDTSPRLFLRGKSDRDASFASEAWLQDQFRVGFRVGVDDESPACPLVFEFPRFQGPGGGLWVADDLSRKLPVCSTLFTAYNQGRTTPSAGQNYGGNLLVSPPVHDSTPAMKMADLAGPAVPPHPPAPLGKLVIGDSQLGPMTPPLRHFLTDQLAQPVLPLDTSWLSVGHVDEFVSFLKSEDEFLALFADPELMVHMLESIEGANLVATTSPILQKKKFRRANQSLSQERLAALKWRLGKGLAMSPSSFIPCPVLYMTAGLRYRAWTSNFVNLQVLGSHVALPRSTPVIERIPREAARGILEDTLTWVASNRDVPQFEPTTWAPDQFTVWVTAGTKLEEIAEQYRVDTGEVRGANPPGLFDGDNQVVADQATGVNRVVIPSTNDDLMELYLRSVFEGLGFTPHFVDTAIYNMFGGEVHCATNVHRDPPKAWTAELLLQAMLTNQDHDLSLGGD